MSAEQRIASSCVRLMAVIALVAAAASPAAAQQAPKVKAKSTDDPFTVMSRWKPTADAPDMPILREYAALERKRADATAGVHRFRDLLRQGIACGELRPDLDVDVVPFVLAGLKFLHLHADLITAGLIDRRRYFAGLVDLAMAALLAPTKESGA